MDSQDIFGVVLWPSSCHDVEILLFFLDFPLKNGHFANMAKTVKKPLFHYFFLHFFIF